MQLLLLMCEADDDKNNEVECTTKSNAWQLAKRAKPYDYPDFPYLNITPQQLITGLFVVVVFVLCACGLGEGWGLIFVVVVISTFRPTIKNGKVGQFGFLSRGDHQFCICVG